VKRINRDAMARAIEWMRQESANSREQIEDKLKREEAGHFAAYAAQCSTLRLKPWESPPSNLWGDYCSDGIELYDRLVAAGLSVFEPDPVKALAEVERKHIA
jgi:hypothetical protein